MANIVTFFLFIFAGFFSSAFSQEPQIVVDEPSVTAEDVLEEAAEAGSLARRNRRELKEHDEAIDLIRETIIAVCDDTDDLSCLTDLRGQLADHEARIVVLEQEYKALNIRLSDVERVNTAQNVQIVDLQNGSLSVTNSTGVYFTGGYAQAIPTSGMFPGMQSLRGSAGLRHELCWEDLESGTCIVFRGGLASYGVEGNLSTLRFHRLDSGVALGLGAGVGGAGYFWFGNTGPKANLLTGEVNGYLRVPVVSLGEKRGLEMIVSPYVGAGMEANQDGGFLTPVTGVSVSISVRRVRKRDKKK